jgi:hypothetical protein
MRRLAPPDRAKAWVSDYVQRPSEQERNLGTLEAQFGCHFPDHLLPAFRVALTEAFLAGAEREPEFQIALDGEHMLRLRLENWIRAQGLDVPTDLMPADPPERK